jgi:nicotinate-nucleotide pyrophosphorylase (carboxylating)
MATELGDLSHLLPAGWSKIVTYWFEEDCPSFDYGGFVVGETAETATLYGKSQVPRP